MNQEDQMWFSRGRTVSAIEPNSRLEFRRAQSDQEQSPNRRGSLMKPSPLLSSSNSKLDEMDYEEKLIRYKLLLEKVKDLFIFFNIFFYLILGEEIKICICFEG